MHQCAIHNAAATTLHALFVFTPHPPPPQPTAYSPHPTPSTLAVATLCSNRNSFPAIVAVTQRLLDAMAALGPSSPHDMDLVAGRLTVDVIGSFGFGRDFKVCCGPCIVNGGCSAYQ